MRLKRAILGSALDVLPTIPDGAFDTIITDPVWPNAIAVLAGSDDPWGLFARAAEHFPRIAKRVVVHLGCDSDPRFLSGLSTAMPYLRTCWLDYACPSYKGRVLYTGDVAYVFGEPPRARPGATVLPGRCTSANYDRLFARKNGRSKKKAFNGRSGPAGQPPRHPCPRRLEHVRWLVKWFAGESVLDPFAGAFTTGVACVEQGVRFTGIEINSEFLEFGARRMRDAQPLFGATA